MKRTLQIRYDKGLFDALPNADKILKFFVFVERRRSDLEEKMIAFKDFIHTYDKKNKATSNIKNIESFFLLD